MLRHNISRPCSWVPAQPSASPWDKRRRVFLVLTLDNDCTLSFGRRTAVALPVTCLRGGCRMPSGAASPPAAIPEATSDTVGLGCGFCGWFHVTCEGSTHPAPPRMPCLSPKAAAQHPVSVLRFTPPAAPALRAGGEQQETWGGEITHRALRTETSPQPPPSSLPSLAGREFGCTPYFLPAGRFKPKQRRRTE